MIEQPPPLTESELAEQRRLAENFTTSPTKTRPGISMSSNHAAEKIRRVLIHLLIILPPAVFTASVVRFCATPYGTRAQGVAESQK